ncbi:alpha/beta hydrolase [Specibacter cremeus]|uniref:alpha/beta hydrolase n=1 Tax=Specibacter cremeus TaxID=1629051 RepID=UPI000F77909F|nr:alpha/beta fold hydrolase [Specibacter cremeus]
MSVITSREQAEIDRANASGKQPVVFVHGLWLLPGSWEAWRTLFQERGFSTLAPGWPDDPETVEEARRIPGVFAGKSIGAITDHFVDIIGHLDRKPVLIGHSFGGLITQKLAGMGLATASVAIDPAPVRGVLPLPLSSLKAASPVIANPANRRRQVMLTEKEFRYAFANAVPEAEAHELYELFPVPGSGLPLFQAAFENLFPRTEASADTRNPDRGPLLVISGEEDHTVPWAVANATYHLQKKNPGVTEIVKIPGRGHSLVIDAGWADVAEKALDFLARNPAP